MAKTNLKIVEDSSKKEEKIVDYIKSLAALEKEMEPYKEQKRELRSEFRENRWLTTDEIRAAVKAYRLFKGKINIDEVVDNYNLLTGENDDS